MKKFRTAVLLSSISWIPTIQADILATGPLGGDATQHYVVCYLFNAGTGSVNITTKSIYRYDPASTAPLTPLDEDTCTTALKAGASCYIQKLIVNDRAHSCRVVVSPSAADIRGRFEIRDQNHFVLQGSDLR